MNITIDRSHFAHAIGLVQKAVPARSTLPILSGIKIEATVNGLNLTATDLEIGIEVFIPTKLEEQEIVIVRETGSVVLLARYISDIVRKLPDAKVDLFFSENDQAVVRSSTAEFNLHTLSAEDYPKLPSVISSHAFSIASDVLAEMIDQTTFAAAKEEAKAALTGVNLSVQEGLLQLVSTDGQRLSKRTALIEGFPDLHITNFIVPAKSLDELSRMLPEDEQLIDIVFSHHQMLVTLPNGRFYSRLIEANYPETARLIPDRFRTVIEIGRDELIAALERVALIARDTDNICRFQILEDVIEIASSSINIGKVQERVHPISIEGESMLLGFKVNNMLEALRTMQSGTVRMKFTSALSSFLLNPKDNDRFLHLMMPYRIA